MAPVTKTRVSLSFVQKKAILEEVEKNLRSKTDIAKAYGIPKSSLSTILKAKENILKAGTSSGLPSARMRAREAKYPELECALVQWMRKIRGKNVPIDGKLLKEQAETYALRMGFTQFKGSDGWLQKFKSRQGLSFNVVSGENASANTEAATKWKEGRLKQLLADYTPEDIFNADETGLMFKLLPDRTLAFKDEKCHGGKRSKERITIMLASNMTGTEKIPVLVIGKSLNPRCFKGIRKLPTAYKANKKAWMTMSIFEEWVLQLDRQFHAKGRKILLVLDNCTAHSQIKNLITLEFLPPNVTSILQPMDQGIIQAFKTHYRRMLLKRIILNLDNNLEYNVNLLAAIHLACAAWDLVTAETIANCFRHAGFASTPEVNPAPEALCQGLDAEDNALLDELRSNNVFVPENTSFAEYANVDSGVACIDELTDEEIIRQAMEPVTAAESSASEDEDSDVHLPPPKPTSKEAASALCILQRYFEDGNADTINILTGLEQQVFRCAHFKQAKITGFINAEK